MAGWHWAADAKDILKGDREVAIVVPPKRSRRSRGSGSEANPVGDPLFEALRELRRQLASEAQVPPYVIFHDSTLRDMTSRRPSTMAEMGCVSGVGGKKLEAYGERFLAEIARH